jgi:phasin family protein
MTDVKATAPKKATTKPKAKSKRKAPAKASASPAPVKTRKAKSAAIKSDPVTAKTALPISPKPAAQNQTSTTMNDTIENMTAASNDALKEGIEKSLTAVNEANTFNQVSVEAVIESATIAGRGLEVVSANAATYAKTAMEEGVAAAKAVGSAKSVHEIFEIQSSFAKTAMDAYLGELNKTSELYAGLVKDATKPLNDRFTAAVDLAHTQR